MEKYTNSRYLLAFGAKFEVIDHNAIEQYTSQIALSDILALIKERKITLIDSTRMDPMLEIMLHES